MTSPTGEKKGKERRKRKGHALRENPCAKKGSDGKQPKRKEKRGKKGGGGGVARHSAFWRMAKASYSAGTCREQRAGEKKLPKKSYPPLKKENGKKGEGGVIPPSRRCSLGEEGKN